MSNSPENPPAFACAAGTPDNGDWQSGMTLRDWFAGMALQGLLGNSAFVCSFYEARDRPGITPPKLAFEMADAMLKARQG